MYVFVLQIWKQKLVQMGATVEDHFSKRVTHILAMNSKALLEKVGSETSMRFKGVSFHFFPKQFFLIIDFFGD